MSLYHHGAGASGVVHRTAHHYETAVSPAGPCRALPASGNWTPLLKTSSGSQRLKFRPIIAGSQVEFQVQLTAYIFLPYQNISQKKIKQNQVAIRITNHLNLNCIKKITIHQHHLSPSRTSSGALMAKRSCGIRPGDKGPKHGGKGWKLFEHHLELVDYNDYADLEPFDCRWRK